MDHYHPQDIIAAKSIDSCSIFVVEPDSSLVIEQTYIYDAAGREIANRRYFQDFSYQYRYNEKGQKTAEYMIPIGEPLYERDTFIYNSAGLLTDRITFGADGNESRRSIYVYQDTLLVKETYMLSGNLHTQFLYVYSQNGLLSKVELYYKGKHSEDWLYTYTTHGKQESFTVRDAAGAVTLKQTFAYNANDLLTRQSIYAGNGTLIQLYLTYYNDMQLITHAESFTEIQNNDPATGQYELTRYTYAYR